MPLQFTITNAGRAAIAQVGGAIGPVTLTKIAIGSGGYTPTATQTALQTEIKRLDPSGSSVPVPGTISITAQDNSADSYSVKEIGLFTNNNVLFAICAQTSVIMTKASGSSALFAMDFVMTNVPAGTVTVGNVGFTYSQATETATGVLGIATTAEAQAGTIDTKIITPLKLAQVTATESRRGVIALATSTEAQALVPDATKALTVARLVDRTATTGRVGVVALATNAQTQTGTDETRAVTPASLASAASLFVPPGAVMPFASAVTPSGWLAANGAAVSRTTYAALFSAIGTLYGIGDGITTFNLPDLRGYFVRGSGKNLDNTESGAFGQKQLDAFKSHTHGGAITGNGGHSHTVGDIPIVSNNGSGGNSGSVAKNDGASTKSTGAKAPAVDGAHIHGLTINLEGDLVETRPKNIALLYCIKF